MLTPDYGSSKRRREPKRRKPKSDDPRRNRLQQLRSLELLEVRMLPATFFVTTTSDSGAGSLRTAITQSNADTFSLPNTIDFDISGSGQQAIQLASALPGATSQVTIDGTSQTGYSGSPLIVIQGTSSIATGLSITSGSTVKGLVVDDFSTSQVTLSGSDTVEDCYIGTNAAGTGNPADSESEGIEVQSTHDTITANLIGGAATAIQVDGGGLDTLITGNTIGMNLAGTTALSGQSYGINFTGGSGNTIGGTTSTLGASPGNLISGFGTDGIEFNGSSSNHVEGNLIGTNSGGTAAFSNGTGVGLFAGASGNTIGGTVSDSLNLISGNTNAGVSISGTGSSGNLIAGDYIGTVLSGSNPLGNGNGIVDATGGNTIGSTVAGAANLISGNSGYGIVESGSSSLIIGNLVGLNALGNSALPNTLNDIRFTATATGNTLGGTTAGARNVISGDGAYGVDISGSSTLVEGNYIGTDITGKVAIANQNSGVSDNGSSNTIGGTVAGAGNLISGNSQNGIYEQGASPLIAGNIIGLNSLGAALPNGVGIDVISSATLVTIGGTVSAAANVVSGNSGNGISLNGNSHTLVEGNLIGTSSGGTSAVANGGDGLEIESGGSNNTVGGTTAGARNVISGNTNYGVLINSTSSTANVVEGNYIGTDITGDVALGNSTGVVLFASGNTIGGTVAGARNIIVGNDGTGSYTAGAQIVIAGDPGVASDDDVIEGNYIGLDASGQALAGATNAGIFFDTLTVGYTIDNTIGGTTAGARNVISGNNGGIFIDSQQNLVEGNYIGTDPTGTTAIGNGASQDKGVTIQDGSQNTIGGSVAGSGNVISGNSGAGIYILDSGASDNVIQGNYIGTDKTGTLVLRNSTGIQITDTAGGNTIGGATSVPGTGVGNLIANSGHAGISEDSNTTGDLILGNAIIDNGSNPSIPQPGISLSNDNGVTIGGISSQDANLISGNNGTGITIDASSSTLVEGNLIGTNAAGNGALANPVGVYVEASSTHNTIGGTVAGSGNVISGNTSYGVQITGSGTNDNLLVGNLIGTNSGGTAALANGSDGVELDTGASNNTIGGTVAGALNVISGNTNNGVEFEGSGTSGNVIEGDYIGTDITGNTALPNEIGILIDSPGNTIGGTVTGASNVISGNEDPGYFAASQVLFNELNSGDQPNDNTVEGNIIGLGANGQTLTGVVNVGVWINNGATGNTIGGTTAAATNVISGNSGDGVKISGTSANVIEGNYIGTRTGGMSPVGNGAGGTGVGVEGGFDNIIGGSVAGAGNVIGGNANNGIRISGSSSVDNVIQGNFVGTNDLGTLAQANGVGIDFQDTGGGNTIGGATSTAGTGAGNLVSGNGSSGIEFYDEPETDVIEGNAIGVVGLLGGGTSPGNGYDGIEVTSSSGAQIGGPNTQDENVISGNNSNGIEINNSSAVLVEGNLIGTDITGTAAVPNATGVAIDNGSTDNAIGGSVLGDLNVISGNTTDGVLITGSGTTGNVVEGDDIGTDVTGTQALANATGVYIDGSGGKNTIGGVTASPGKGAGNLIAGNQYGLILQSESSSNPDVIQGNLIGVEVILGALSSPANTTDGIYVEYASGILIGGLNAGDANVISGNNDDGLVFYDSSSNLVQGNFIGTDSTGTTAEPNNYGLLISESSTYNTIGGNTTAARNIISGNYTTGLLLYDPGTTGNLIEGDYIGTDATGTQALGNAVGIDAFGTSGGNTIGGALTGEGNLISGNSSHGIQLEFDSSGDVIEGNTIGLNATGTSALANGGDGIFLEYETGDIIGGVSPAQANVISANLQSGIEINGSSGTLVEGNLIGTKSSGTTALGNVNGVEIDGGSQDNTIGGTTAGAGNVISGNTSYGVQLTDSGTTGNVLLDNFIGTDITGTQAVANGLEGVNVTAGASNNTIGGSDPVSQVGLVPSTGLGTPNALVQAPNGDIYVADDSQNEILEYVPGSSTPIVVSSGQLFTSLDATPEALALDGLGNLIVTGGDFGSASGSIIKINLGGPVATNQTLVATGGPYLSGYVPTDVVVNAAGNYVVSDYQISSIPNQGQGLVIVVNATTGVVTPLTSTIPDNLEGIAQSSSGTLYLSVSEPGPQSIGQILAVNPTTGAVSTVSTTPDYTFGTGLSVLPDGNLAWAVQYGSGSVPVGEIIEVNPSTGSEATVASGGDLVNTIDVIPEANGDFLALNALFNPSTYALVQVNLRPDANVISGNTDHGVEITGTGTNNNVVAGNLIGTDLTGTLSLPNGSDGVVIDNGATGNTIGGMTTGSRNIISGNGLIGVDLDNASSNFVEGDYIGTDISGIRALGNEDHGIQVTGANEMIGGPSTSAGVAPGNVIAANGGSGIFFSESPGGSLVEGNLIGLGADGLMAMGNDYGVYLQDSPDVTIGGTVAADRNVVSANIDFGIGVGGISPGAVIEGNYVGTDITGTLALGNTLQGILVTSADVVIGGLTAIPGTGAGNVASGNGTGVGTGNGIFVGGSDDLVEGNIAGLDPTGTFAVGTQENGIEVVSASNNTIGGTLAGAGNLLSGNSYAGLLLGSTGAGYPGSSDNLIEGNLIGTNLADTSAVANGNYGIGIFGSSNGNTIGGTVVAARNVISGNTNSSNTGTGIYITGPSSGNLIEGNYIGTDATGVVAIPNNYGVELDSSGGGNTIGGATSSPGTGAGNLIAGMSLFGIFLNGETAVDWILGNLVGAVGLAGGGESPTDYFGIYVHQSTGTVIGGPDSLDENVISGCVSGEITFDGSSKGLVEGNLIGSDLTGAIHNYDLYGVVIQSDSTGNTIGGTIAADRNVIWGSSAEISITSGSKNNVIEGDYIGTDAAGTVGSINGPGVLLSQSGGGNTIGGATATPGTGAGNLIAGRADGIQVGGLASGSTDVIEGNLIGVGSLPGGGSSPANGCGILAQNTTGFLIGGTSPLDANVISGNTVAGVQLDQATGVLIEGDLIGTNLTGTAAVPNSIGIQIFDGSTDNTIGGTSSLAANVISGNAYFGIDINDSSGNLVAGNLIGTDSTGTNALTNGAVATGASSGDVDIDSSTNNTIGGTVASARNVISGSMNANNSACGIYLTGPSTGNLIEGDYVGTNILGTSALGNSHGIEIENTPAGNTIGGTLAGAGNVISGNSVEDVSIYGNGNTGVLVEGNIVGLNAAGTAILSTNTDQFSITTAGNTIGGTTPAARNVITGDNNINTRTTIALIYSNATGNLIEGNYIGTNATGAMALSVTGQVIGEFGATGNTIGGSVAGAGNLIDAVGGGIGILAGSNDLIEGNQIGTVSLGRLSLGIAIGGNNNTIGGTTAGMGNVIEGSTGDGVQVQSGTGNAIRGNSIYANGQLGIDLGISGVPLANTLGGATSGPNLDENTPVLTLINYVSGSGTTIAGDVNTTPNTTVYVDFYSDPTENASGYGEGQTYLGSVTLITSSSGNASFTFNDLSVPAHTIISTTATTAAGNTSEFSKDLAEDNPPIVSFVAESTYQTPASAATTFNEGTPIYFDASKTSSPDGDSLTYTWYFDDGSATVTTSVPYITHSYNVDGTYVPTVIVNDGYGGIESDLDILTVAKVKPTISFVSLPTSAAVGTTANFDLAINDPTDDRESVVITWGDGSSQTLNDLPTGSSTFEVAHTYSSPLPGGATSATVTATVTDASNPALTPPPPPLVAFTTPPTFDIGGFSGSISGTVGVYQQSPSFANVTLGQDAVAVNGAVTLSGKVVDPNPLVSHTVTINWGDSATASTSIVLAPGVSSFSTSHTYTTTPFNSATGTYPQIGTYTIALNVVSSNLLTGSATTSIEVDDVTPVVQILVVPDPDNPSNVSLVADVIQSAAINQLTYLWVATSNDSTYATGNQNAFTFSAPAGGAFSVTLKVVDQDGASDQANTQVLIGPSGTTNTVVFSPVPDSTQDQISIDGTTSTSFTPGTSIIFYARGPVGASNVVDASAISTPIELVGSVGGLNTLIAGSGNDTLVGGLGNDYLVGTSGTTYYKLDFSGLDPTLVASTGLNVIDLTDTTQNITLNLGLQTTQTVDPENDVVLLKGTFEDVLAGTGNDTLYSANGVNSLIVGGSGNDLLYSVGSGNSSIMGGSGNATIVGGGGNDIIYGVGSGNSSVMGGSGNSTIVGGSGNDIIYGVGSGNSSIVGGSGNATIVGGGGNSIIYGSGSGNSSIMGGSGNSTIVGGSGNDIIYGVGSGNTSIMGGSGNATIVGGGGNDIIYGVGSGNTSISGGSGNATIVGGSGNDIIYGVGSGNTSIMGGSGNATIVGGSGNDIIYGAGSGNSSIMGGSGNSTIVGGSGNDIIYGLGSGNTSIMGGSGNATIVGGGGNDIIYGQGSGNSSIAGGSGNATIVGGSGNDIIYGLGSGNSSIVGGSGNATIVGAGGNSIIYGAGSGNSSIMGGSGNSTIVGGSGNDIIYGLSSGNSSIVGGSGNATIVGAGGNDIIYGLGSGNTSIVGGSGNATVVGAGGNDVIYGVGSGNSSVMGGSGNSTIVGGSGNDIIYGLGSGNTSIVGGSGNATVVGGSGNDIIYGVGSGNSSIVGGSGNATIVGAGGNDVIYGLGSGNSSVMGGTGNNTIVGGSGNDIIYGLGSGNSSIVGGSGNATIVGAGGNSIIYGLGSGNTSIVGGSGNQTIVGGTGNDIIYGLGSGNSSVVGGSGNATIVGGGGNSIIYGVGSGNTSIMGGSGNSTIVGGSGNDIIYGLGSGNTSIVGGSGNATIVGAGGNSIIYGVGSGNTSIVGGSGNQTIVGGSGNDIIYGVGSGNTSIVGGSGNSTIVGGSGNDIIYGVGSGNTSIVGGSGNTTIVGGSGNDIIYGGTTGYETIQGGSGSATITGGGGADLINGGPGKDLIYGGLGLNTLSGGGGNDIIYGGPNDWLVETDPLATSPTTVTLTNSMLFMPGFGTDMISGITNVMVGLGEGSFVLDATQDTLPLVLVAGTGDDTILAGKGNDTVYAGTGIDSLVGGGGNDTYVFGPDAQGDVTIDDPSTANDTLDFSLFNSGINLDLEAVGPQVVSPGVLTLTLTNPIAVDQVFGTSYPDTILGNGRNDTLIGNGGDDYLNARGGAALIEGYETQVVYLDFLQGDVDYSAQSTRDAIQARIAAIYSDFNFEFTQTQPTSGPYETLYFNVPAGSYLGGEATELDWRNLDLGGSASIDIGSFLSTAADPNPALPEDTLSNIINMTATIGAHELGHLSGLIHGDSLGPIGAGIYVNLADNPYLDGYHPSYPGPDDADETRYHVMGSPDSVGTTLFDAATVTFFGEREAISMAFADSGTTVNETTGDPNTSVATAQPLTLSPLVVPNTLLFGQDVGTTFNVTATDVVGSIELGANGQSNADYYAITATKGELLNLQIYSASITRDASDAIDSELTVYEADGTTVVPYYNSTEGATNDDGFQDADAVLLDLTIPCTGTYYIEVSTYFAKDSLGILHNQDVGSYELFMYSFAATTPTANSTPKIDGDTLIGGSGQDTLSGSSANDLIEVAPGDTVISGSGTNTIDELPGNLTITGPETDNTPNVELGLEGSFTASNPGMTYDYDWHVVSSNGQAIMDVTGSMTPPSQASPDFAGADVGADAGVNESIPFQFTPDAAGLYTITLTITDGYGGTSQSSFQETVVSAPSLTAEIGTGASPIAATVGSPITLTATQTGTATPTSYLWTVAVPTSAPTIASGQSSSYLFAPSVAGSYVITLQECDGYGDKFVTTTTVVVAAAPTPSAQILGVPSNLFEAEGYSFTLSGLVSNPNPSNTLIESWTVTADNGSVAPYTVSGPLVTSVTYTPDDTGSYTVTLNLLNANGQVVTSTSQQIIAIGVAPTAYLTGGPTGGTTTEGTSLSFSGSATSPSMATTSQGFYYIWSVTYDSVTYEDTPTKNPAYQFTPELAGSYVVSLEVDDYHGFSSLVQTETINVVPVAPMVMVSGLPTTSTIVEGTTVSLGSGVSSQSAELQGDGFSEAWSVQYQGVTYGPYYGPSLNFTAGGVGSYIVTLSATDSEGVTGSTTTTILAADVAPVVVDPSSPQDAQQATLTSFNLGTVTGAGLDGGVSTVVINWGDGTSPESFAINAQGSLGTLSHAYDLPGQYPVSITVTDQYGLSGSTSFSAVVAPVAPSPTILGVSDTSVDAGTLISLGSSVSDLSQTETDLGFNYSWSVTYNNAPLALPNGTVTNASTFSFTPQNGGTYAINLSVTDSSNSVGVAPTKSINVNDLEPTATITGGSSNVPIGTLISLTGSATDPANVAQPSNFSYKWTVTGPSTSLTGTGSTFSYTPAYAGTYTVGLIATNNLNGLSSGLVTATETIEKGTPTVTWATPAAITYGTKLTAAQLDASPSISGTLVYTPALGTLLDAGSQTLYVTLTPTDTTNQNVVMSSVPLTVNVATPVVSVSDGGIYDGSPFPATASVTGISGSACTTLEGIGLTLTYYNGSTVSGTALTAAPSLAGTYTVVASFAGSTDYAAVSSSATFVIARATPTVAVTDAGGTYDGSTFPATATVAGLNGTACSTLETVGVTLAYYSGSTATGTPLGAAPSKAGTYTVLAAFAGSVDYAAASASQTFTIGQAKPTVAVTDAGGTYTGAAFPVTDSVTGISGPAGSTLEGVGLTLTYYTGSTATGTSTTTAPIDAGTYTVVASFAGSTDYAAESASASFTIGTAIPKITVTDAGGTYDNSTYPATDSVAGINGSAGSMLESVGLTLTYYAGTVANGTRLTGAPTAAGNYSVVAAFAGSADYAAASANTTFTIAQATPKVTVTDLGGTYNGSTFPATDSVTGISGSAGSTLESVGLTLTYYAGSTATGTGTNTAPSAARTYTVVASFAGSTDYAAASATTSFTIKQATPSLTLTAAGGTYNGSAFTASATVTGVGGTAAGSLENVTPNLAYYAGSTASGTALSGAPTTAGTYTVLASFAGSTDYTSASASKTFVIKQAAPTVAVSDSGGAYTGSAYAATATVTGVTSPAAGSLENVTPTLTYYSGSTASGTSLSGAPTTAGTYTVLANFAGSADYVSAFATATFAITQRATTTTLTASSAVVMAGQPITFTATVATGVAGLFVPAGETVQLQVNGSNSGSPVAVNASGVASFTTTLVAGTPSITVVYSGDTNFKTSVSAPLIVNSLKPGVTAIGTTLYVTGGTTSDNAVITPTGSSSTGSTGVSISSTINNTFASQTFNQTFTTISIDELNGNDNIQLASTLTLPTTAIFGNGNDYLQLAGGNDTITLGSGNDQVFGGNGNKTITEQDGTGASSYISLGTGNDVIGLGNGNDQVNLVGGGVTVTGGNGNDTVINGNGGASVVLGNGNDYIKTGVGTDAVSLGSGNETIVIGGGTSVVTAGGGNNFLSASGNATISMGNGNDTVELSNGANGVALGNGNDFVSAGTGGTKVTAGNGNDTIELGAATNSVSLGNGNDYVSAGVGNATVTGGNGNDTVQLGGGSGNTVVVTLGNGNDYVSTGDSNDTVTVGTGNDTTQLGNGSDIVVEGSGNDYVSAGNGSDLVVGGSGQHTIQLGNGNDILIDGTASIVNAGDSLAQILAAWNTSSATSVNTRIKVTYAQPHPSYLSAGSGRDWFFYLSPTTSNKKSTDRWN